MTKLSGRGEGEAGAGLACRLDKARENQKSLEVLPILLAELDALPGMERLTALIEGALAANIFDWGAQACMKYYASGSIVNVYRSVSHVCLKYMSA